ncbi:MAG: leucine-rich repeat domain-containing protein [Acutalibacteraceae bacterium]|nr:leucine-rich repeat domain-containing protein [Acutalibacteraceae bacterium]
MREIILSINNNHITSSTDCAGYKGEHNATYLKFELPDELQKSNYKYQANIALPNDITATVTLTDMTLPLTSALTACEGIIQIQLVITETNALIYKSGTTNLKIKQSLAPTAVIGGGSGIENVMVNEEGNLIITLSGGKEINAGYVKGDKGDTGDTYTLSEEDKQVVADKLSNDIIKGIIEHNTSALDIPEGTTQIADYQFQNNANLRKVVIPNSLEVIGTDAFQGCFRLTGIDGMRGVKEVKTHAFLECTSLTDVEFPEALEVVGAGAFQSCLTLRSENLILPNCKKVLEYAFNGCGFTGKLDLSSCEEIYANTFVGCDFSKLILSNKLKIFNRDALNTCRNLEFVDLGEDFNCNGFNLSMSAKYSVETLVGVLNSLKNRVGETAYILYLGATNLAKLTDEHKAIATNKNWVLA